MKAFGSLAWVLAGVTPMVLVTPAWAADSQVTGIHLAGSGSQLELSLDLRGKDSPRITTTRQGNSWVADIAGATLRLPDGQSQYRQSDPAPGITSVYALPVGNDRIKVFVTGQNQPPSGTLTQQGPSRIVFSLANISPAARQPPLTSGSPLPTPPRPGATLPAVTAQGSQPAAPLTPVPTPPEVATQARQIAQAERPNQPNVPLPANRPNPVPPFQPGAVAPPVGDIAIGNIELTNEILDLGASGQARLRRIVLREAPVREVLDLLSQASGLNFIFREPEDVAAQAGETVVRQTGAVTETVQRAGTEGREARPAVITLNIQNESVQDVFNYVLRLTGLQANRVGRTVFVGQNLPVAARNLVMRTYRLNQIPATLDSGQVLRNEGGTLQIQAIGNTGGSGGSAQTTDLVRGAYQTNRTSTLRGAREQLLALAGPGLPLEGLQVVADTRLNTVTLIGGPSTVDTAAAYLAQMDVRKRQVAVRVQVVDLSVRKDTDLGTSFQFRLGEIFGAVGTGAQGVGSSGQTAGNFQGSSGQVNNVFGLNIPGNNLQAQINASVSNGTAKILTDPTLMIQEGSESRVNVTEDVVANIRRTRTTTGTTTDETIEVVIVPVGIILAIAVPQIDDNGFITLYVDPVVSSPGATADINTGNDSGGDAVINTIQLIQRRQLSTGAVRVRDGQSLILTGLIQDQDRNEVTKVPILGDIPLLGALFRRTTTNRLRREVVIVLTPNVVDDSDQQTAGYQYAPRTPEVQRLIEQGNPTPPQPR